MSIKKNNLKSEREWETKNGDMVSFRIICLDIYRYIIYLKKNRINKFWLIVVKLLMNFGEIYNFIIMK